MNELLQSIKADLLSRRMLPVLVVLGVALLAAVGYAVASSGTPSTPPAPSVPPVSPTAGQIQATLAPPNTKEAVAETPAGSHYQTKGATRNPFKPLPGAGTQAQPNGQNPGGESKSSSGSGSSSSSGAAGTPAKSGGGGTPTPSNPNPKPAPEPKIPQPQPLIGYQVSVLFGLAPAEAGQPATLTPYDTLKRFEPLPSAKSILVVFVGVSKDTHKAVFAFVVPPILRGPGVCVPSSTQCEGIELAKGQSEELEYQGPNEQSVAFELKVVQIRKRSTAAAASKSARYLKKSKPGLWALRRAGLSFFK